MEPNDYGLVCQWKSSMRMESFAITNNAPIMNMDQIKLENKHDQSKSDHFNNTFFKKRMGENVQICGAMG